MVFILSLGFCVLSPFSWEDVSWMGHSSAFLFLTPLYPDDSRTNLIFVKSQITQQSLRELPLLANENFWFRNGLSVRKSLIYLEPLTCHCHDLTSALSMIKFLNLCAYLRMSIKDLVLFLHLHLLCSKGLFGISVPMPTLHPLSSFKPSPNTR